MKARTITSVCRRVINSVAKTIDDDIVRELFLDHAIITGGSIAITLSDKVQIVTRFFGEPAEIHENYDFDHCRCFWSSWDSHLELPRKALESLLSRSLQYSGSKYPLCSIIRARKFINRGWTITAGQYVKMAWQLNALNLTEHGVLEEQLTGVDFAYFQEIISELRKRDSEKIEGTYLFTLIDKVM